VMPRADLNLVFVRFFVVVVGRIVAFIVVVLFGFFSLFCLSQRYCPKFDPRLRGKLGTFTEGNEGSEESLRNRRVLQKDTNGKAGCLQWNPD